MKNNTSCAVLLAAFNGEDWIEEQIESILNQKNIDVHIYVSLDISSDSTIEILNKIIDKDKRVILVADALFGVLKIFSNFFGT